MRRIILLVLALTLVLSVSSMAAKITATKVQHFNNIYQAYCGNSVCCPNGIPENFVYEGFLTQLAEMGDFLVTPTDAITANPGILAINPGGPNWPNFVGATAAQVPYTIKNVTLVKETTIPITQCADVFLPVRIPQQGTANIRKWWPLMYEVPGTTFTLDILYGTSTLWQDSPQNPPGYVHVDEWIWTVVTDIPHMINLLDVFHTIPFGLDEVPLISDEDLYAALRLKLQNAQTAVEGVDYITAAEILQDFELEVMDAMIIESPQTPRPSGGDTGIAQTEENPAMCKLLVDAEYMLLTVGIGQQAK